LQDGLVRAFTLMEVMCTLVLVLLLIIAAISAITFLSQSSGRVADYAAAMAAVSGKLEAIRAATYKPPNSPFTASTVLLTNSARIALAKSGTNFLVSGSIVSEIKPMAGGHLVTVTGTFQTPQRPLSVSLQTLVNHFTGGDE
jgi:type II secretory pathway pseudopilin PulG